MACLALARDALTIIDRTGLKVLLKETFYSLSLINRYLVIQCCFFIRKFDHYKPCECLNDFLEVLKDTTTIACATATVRSLSKYLSKYQLFQSSI